MTLCSDWKRVFFLFGITAGLCSSLGGQIAYAAGPVPELPQITESFSGSVSPSGAVEDNQTETIIGEITRDGLVYNGKGEVVGSIDSKGIVKDSKGKAIATVALKNRLAAVAFLLRR